MKTSFINMIFKQGRAFIFRMNLPGSALLFFCIAFCNINCKKYVEVGSNKDQLLASQVFSNEGTANNAIAGIYRTFRDRLFGSTTQTVFTGLAGDELYNFFSDPYFDEYNRNAIQSTNPTLPWTNLYNIIYQSNLAIEGLQMSNSLSTKVKNQFMGESRFIRAFSYFYLVNLFGDVPLLTSSDVKSNTTASRTGVAKVYKQIIADLIEAQNLLVNDYSYSSGEHVRANKMVTKALLARVYLYQQDWANAEIQASDVIGSSAYKLLTNIDSFGIKNNNEAIFQCANNTTDANFEPTYFIFTSSPILLCTDFLLNAFEPLDQRKAKWIKSTAYSGTNYYYPYKYKLANIPGNEYYTVLRLGEQYLIRAEARVKQNNLLGGSTDLNVIRNRAGLANTTAATQGSLLTAIYHERQVELFAETGHRWFDLKRTGQADIVLGSEKPTVWKPTAGLYPIPLDDIHKDNRLVQNPGY